MIFRKPTLEDVSLHEIDDFYNELTEEKEFINNPVSFPLDYVAGYRIGDKLVAVGGLKKYCFFLHFSFMIVQSSYQGQGIAKKLRKQYFEYAMNKGYSCILATVNGNNKALAIDIKAGYRIIYHQNELFRLIYPLNRWGILLSNTIPFLFSAYFSMEKVIKSSFGIFHK
jgi:GNAT superfamily N-acetyltransferase